jgi:hypothetical protein
MLTYFSAVWAGEASPLWPRVWLLSISIVAAFSVGAGILLESPKYSAAVHRVATWLVLGGIAVESLCTVLLFVFDERISAKQESTIAGQNKEIISLQKRLAPRQLDSDAQKRVADAIRSYEHPSFEVMAATIEPGSKIVSEIITCLESAGWILTQEPDSRIPRNATDARATFVISDNLGVWIDFIDRDASRLASLAEQLATAFQNEGIVAQHRSLPDPRLPPGTVRILISPKP